MSGLLLDTSFLYYLSGPGPGSLPRAVRGALSDPDSTFAFSTVSF